MITRSTFSIVLRFLNLLQMDLPPLILYDLETTDLIDPQGNHPDILEIAALNVLTGETFHRYVKNVLPIHPEAAKFNGFSDDDPRLINAPSVKVVMDDFTTWLNPFGKVILMAHNGNRFDNLIMRKFLPQDQIIWADSLDLFRERFPTRSSCSLPSLQHDLLPDFNGRLHSAQGDVECLHKLLKIICT